MTAQYALHLAMWLFLGVALVGSHIWNAAYILLDTEKPRP